MKFFSWPKFDEGCWNYHIIPVHAKAVSILSSGVKKNGKIVPDYFAVLTIILPWIWQLFVLVGKMDTTSLTCECSCKLCPNVGQFFSVGDATASPTSPCRMLMVSMLLPGYHKNADKTTTVGSFRISCLLMFVPLRGWWWRASHLLICGPHLMLCVVEQKLRSSEI